MRRAAKRVDPLSAALHARAVTLATSKLYSVLTPAIPGSWSGALQLLDPVRDVVQVDGGKFSTCHLCLCSALFSSCW
jgi:hypothetical protein